MRDTRLRRVAVVVALSLGIVTVGLAGAGRAALLSVAEGTSSFDARSLGLQAATLASDLDRSTDRITSGRSTPQKCAIGLSVLLFLAGVCIASAGWSASPGEVANRSRAVPPRAPQRGPPAPLLSLA